MDALKGIIFYKTFKALSANIAEDFMANMNDLLIYEIQHHGLTSLVWDNAQAHKDRILKRYLESYVSTIAERTEEVGSNFKIVLCYLINLQCELDFQAYKKFRHEYLESSWKLQRGPFSQANMIVR